MKILDQSVDISENRDLANAAKKKKKKKKKVAKAADHSMTDQKTPE